MDSREIELLHEIYETESVGSHPGSVQGVIVETCFHKITADLADPFSTAVKPRGAGEAYGSAVDALPVNKPLA